MNSELIILGGGLSNDTSSTGTDANAIHNNASGEINAIAVKGTPVNADMALIEDSADGFSKKKVALTNLLSPGLGGSIIIGPADTINTWRIIGSTTNLLFEIITSISPTVYTEVMRFTL